MTGEKPNWRSKSMVAHVAHLGVALAGICGVIADHASAGTVVPAWIAGHLGIAGLHNTTTAATERAQAQSPYYPSGPGQAPPPEPPPQPDPTGPQASAGPGVTLKPPS